MKLTYNALLEKAESREKERLKEEAKRFKKIESEIRSVGRLQTLIKNSWKFRTLSFYIKL